MVAVRHHDDGRVRVVTLDRPARRNALRPADLDALAAAVVGTPPDVPGVALGLFGAWGGTVRLPRIVGEGEALDLALSGRVVDAEEARRIGLVSRVVADPRTVADEVAAHPADALRGRTTGKGTRRDRRPATDYSRGESGAGGIARLCALAS
jgi:enoyl-CoA hydratase/carnithine racemase